MKKLWKRIALLMVLVLAFAFTGCGGDTDKAGDSGEPDPGSDVLKVGFVSDQALDASEWLVNLVAGVQEYQNTHEGVEIKLVEAIQANEYEPKIRGLAEAGYNVIITTQATTAEATKNVARDYPDITFGSLDGSIEDIADYSNIQEFGLNRTETAYLGGVCAAAMSESGTVGIIGGMDEPIINAIIAGWQQGLYSVNPNIKDYVSYAGTWTDPTVGKDLGLALVNRGCDVIAAAAGGTGAGTAQAAAETNTMFVAWDTHYDEIFENANVELGSALNYFDVMVIAFIEDVINGNFEGGKRVDYGMEQGVCAFDIKDSSIVTDEAKALVEQALEKIKNGEIEISTEPIHK